MKTLSTPQRENNPGFWNGALFGTLLGMGTLLTYQYFSGILRRPRLVLDEIFSDEVQFESKEALAVFIAAQNLRSGIKARYLPGSKSKEILHAGYRNFHESWARDFSFASFGLTVLEQFHVVKETLEAFLWHQSPQGQLPVKLYSINPVTRFLYSLFGREQPVEFILKPKYISGHGTPSLDGQALLVIAAQNYSHKSDDLGFLKAHWDQLTLAMNWLEGHRSIPYVALLFQGAYSDWADSVARRGYVLYTNVVYWKALSVMGAAAERLNREKEAELYFAQAEAVSRAIQDVFWKPKLGYFVTSDQLEQFSSDGNLLAVAWGLALPGQAESILKFMEKAEMSQPVPTRVAYPSYPASLIAIENRLGGVANYHTSASWLWLGAWHVIALVQSEQVEQAQAVMGRIADVILKDGKVNEVHGKDGKPLESIWYKSEAPLTWNAGMVVYACSVYEAYKHMLLNSNSRHNE